MDIMEALKEIKEICTKHERCVECPFCDIKSSTGTMCGLRSKNPCLWELEKKEIVRYFKEN